MAMNGGGLSRKILAVFFILAGLNHFRQPAIYLSMMPPALPWPDLLVAISGVAEILGGLGLLIPRFQRAAGWGLIALLIAVFPANIHVALNDWPDMDVPRWALWVRLPLQFALIAWVHRAAISQKNAPS
jgi:uncharacterized membrane protein